ncbi:unnamed protein product [Prorocentrum cordatum]|uniref:Thioredoxin domain-containing protein n=1 Tax=Prorocentrum cordatum TaxID=2364126 RepID=A0ABN9WL97_9DINO|nr:unnamed protein product [Polarella glacialis]|mmetsp:Transcript_86761/g.232729  ORF Transcript_86761/g.232729 Transcript_86761/m.232729 type:complete len:183 (-) Transcript_86761:151-699(-)
MKPDWDALRAEYKNHSTILIADVDCTASGRALCQEVGVRGYPTLKWGDPDDLQDYKGGRALEDLRKFVADLRPLCGPVDPSACSDAQRKMIEEFTKMGGEKREGLIQQKVEEIEAIEAKFKQVAEGISKEYEAASKRKKVETEALDPRELGWLKAVRALAAQSGGTRQSAGTQPSSQASGEL